MIDGYTIRNITMFCFPVYGWLIYKWYKWPKFTPYIALGLSAYLLFTIPYQNYFHKPKLINRIISIYQKDKKEEIGLVYHQIPIKPRFWGGMHQSFPILDYNKTKSDDIVFRLLVWEDLCNELIRNHAWFGMGFSHPLRSPQIEMLHIAESEWHKDGWICAHNSYLYVIYRIGIIGVALLAWLFFKLTIFYIKFFNSKDIVGIVLMICASYWLLQATFQIQFESPYYAVPLWSLVGLILNRAKAIKTTTSPMTF